MTRVVASHQWADGQTTAVQVEVEELLYDTPADAVAAAVDGCVRAAMSELGEE